jgi:UDP-N-acetylmuramate--alanine ligase
MNGSFGIAVAGTHGKTTTTGMIGQVMIDAGLDPTLIVGAELPVLASNGRAGEGDYFIIEADEYDHMFLGLRPNLAIVTNVEYDHPDLFPSRDDYRGAFMQFAERIHKGGHLIACADDPGSQSLSEYATTLPLQIETYGLKNGQWQATEVRSNQLGGSDFLVRHNSETVGLARLRVPGEHNVLNALATVAAAITLGVKFDTIRAALGKFEGLGRRFQVVGEIGDVAIVDDYAHHPTEIKATLAAARQRFSSRRIWAIWQPHTFSRTKTMLGEFAGCFEQADRVVVLDIYRSRERDTLGVESTQLVNEINNAQVNYASGIDEAVDYLFDRVTPGDVVITLSAGDGNLVGEKLFMRLEDRVKGVNGVAETKRT